MNSALTITTELEELQFGTFWDPSDDQPKQDNSNSSSTSLIETKLLGDDHQTTDTVLHTSNNVSTDKVWKENISLSILNLKRRPRVNFVQSFKANELFSSDGYRYTVKLRKMQVFESFPWFLSPHISSSSQRLRETLVHKKGESIEEVTNAINYFYTERFDEADYLFLTSYYMKHGPPCRILWSIVELKLELEKDRTARRVSEAQIEVDELTNRLSVIEKKVEKLQEYFFQRNSKRKSVNDSENDNLIKTSSKLQRLEELEVNVQELAKKILDERISQSKEQEVIKITNHHHPVIANDQHKDICSHSPPSVTRRVDEEYWSAGESSSEGSLPDIPSDYLDSNIFSFDLEHHNCYCQ